VSTVLCDSGPLIALAKIGRLHLLVDLWHVIQITEEVYREAATPGYTPVIPDALIIRLFCQRHKLPIVAVPQHILESYQPTITLDPGEHATFAYALTLAWIPMLVF
jgi:predicted nucleic acid-binding protein